MKQIQFLFDISPKVKHQKTSLRAFELIKEKGDGFWRLGIQLKAQICYVVDSGFTGGIPWWDNWNGAFFFWEWFKRTKLPCRVLCRMTCFEVVAHVGFLWYCHFSSVWRMHCDSGSQADLQVLQGLTNMHWKRVVSVQKILDATIAFTREARQKRTRRYKSQIMTYRQHSIHPNWTLSWFGSDTCCETPQAVIGSWFKKRLIDLEGFWTTIRIYTWLGYLRIDHISIYLYQETPQ